jgi:hypothetical protein
MNFSIWNACLLSNDAVVMAKKAVPSRILEKKVLFLVGFSDRGSFTTQASADLLDRMLLAISLYQKDVFLIELDQKSSDLSFEKLIFEVKKQLTFFQPQCILFLGKKFFDHFSSDFFLFESIQAKVSFHPAELLQSASDKKQAWKDLQEVAFFLNLPLKSGGKSHA